ncbi:MAG: hypothetical protein ACREDR_38200, partial [Blastocatellia bacterium]
MANGFPLSDGPKGFVGDTVASGNTYRSPTCGQLGEHRSNLRVGENGVRIAFAALASVMTASGSTPESRAASK